MRKAPLTTQKQGSENRSLKNYQDSTEGQKFRQNLAPVMVIISGNSLAFSRKLLSVLVIILRHCAPDAPAPVVKNQSPREDSTEQKHGKCGQENADNTEIAADWF